MPALSRRRIRQKIQEGDCRVNGRRHTASTRLREGDLIELRWRETAGEPAEAPAPVILYEDDELLAVDKPAGVPVHPVGRKQAGTLIQILQSRFRPQIAHSLVTDGGDFYPSLVNRLDLFTSGVVLVAKRRAMLRVMHRLIAEGGIRKRYAVLVRGRVEPETGTIDLPIGPAGTNVAIRQAVRSDGLPSRTEYRVLERLNGHTLLQAFPLTGRQHQLRVHFAAAGHPVWGDLIYDDEELFLRYIAGGCRLDPSLPPRQGLHADRLAFRHPLSGRPVEIAAPWPADFLQALAGLPSRH